MTPKEKAQELVDKFQKYAATTLLYGMTLDESVKFSQMENSKKCALIAVDEIINYLTTSLDVQTSLSAVDYWLEVKTEIKKL